MSRLSPKNAEAAVLAGAMTHPHGHMPGTMAHGRECPMSGKKAKFPRAYAIILALLMLGCLLCDLIMTKDPAYLDIANCGVAPCREFLFGTDSLGRDIFSCIWQGGRVSIFIGFAATAISTLIAVVYGGLAGVAPKWLDTLMMRFTDIILSVPELLVIIFVQAILGEASVLSISVVIGVTSWAGISKIVRTEVRQLRNSEYVLLSKCMGGGFFYTLRRHLAPNFVSSIMFMVVMNIRGAIASESTLSFMGIGLPIETISWGSMLSLADKAFLTGAWWIIVIPGAFLVVLLLCITELGNYLRKSINKKESNM